MVIADFERALAFVRHMTVGAGHSRTRVDTLIPQLEIGMLRFEYRGAGVGMRPIFELRLVVVSLNLFDLEPFGPRIDETLFRSLEIIFDMALAADIGAHFLARCLPVD